MTTAVFPSLLHEDPRYYQLAKGSFSHRAYYAMNRLFVSRTDAGSSSFNYSEFVGNAAAAAISNIYHPAQDRTAIPKRSHLWFSDSLRRLGQRTQGILAGHTPQSASQEESLVPLDTPLPLASGPRRRYRFTLDTRHCLIGRVPANRSIQHHLSCWSDNASTREPSCPAVLHETLARTVSRLINPREDP